jgi:hypothetical protein
MKRMPFVFPIVCLIILIGIHFSACDNDSTTPEPDSEFREQISAVWTLQHAIVDGTDITAAFPNLTLTVNIDGEFTVTNPISPIWPSEGTYFLEKDPTSEQYTIVRSDGLEIEVVNITSSTLELHMQFQPSSGRTKSIGGVYEFLFVK